MRAAEREVYVHDHAGYGNGRGRSGYVTDPDGRYLELCTWEVATQLAEHAAGTSPGSH